MFVIPKTIGILTGFKQQASMWLWVYDNLSMAVENYCRTTNVDPFTTKTGMLRDFDLQKWSVTN